MNPLFLNLILGFCFAGIANCDEGSQDSENQNEDTILVDEDLDNQLNDDAILINNDENEKNADMLTLLAGTIGRELMPDEAVNMAIAEQNNN